MNDEREPDKGRWYVSPELLRQQMYSLMRGISGDGTPWHMGYVEIDTHEDIAIRDNFFLQEQMKIAPVNFDYQGRIIVLVEG